MKFQVLPFENWTWWRHLSTTHKDASNKGHTRARPSIRRTTLPPSSLLFSALSLAAYSSARTTFFRNVAKWEILRIVILKNQLPHKVACPLSLSLSRVPRVESREIFPVCLMTNACLHECEHIRSERGAARNITRTSVASPGPVVGN